MKKLLVGLLAGSLVAVAALYSANMSSTTWQILTQPGSATATNVDSTIRPAILAAGSTLSGSFSGLFNPPLTPANGGVGAMTSAPMWARNFGDGSGGAGPSSGTLNVGEQWFSSWTCTGAVVATAGGGSIVVRSTGTIALNTGCSLSTSGKNNSANGDFGGGGAAGGAGAANGVTGIGGVINSYTLSGPGTGGAGAGPDGGTIAANALLSALSVAPYFDARGGGHGGAGGSSGGAAGNGGGLIVLIAPTITIASGVTIDASGTAGVAPAANSTGAGGGGGGGLIILSSINFTDSGAIYKYGGGPGGAITQPSIQATGGGCDTTGCGIDAAFTITALVGGGLSAGSITISNAGTGYKTAPFCLVNAGTSGLVGSPACHFTLSGGTIASVVIDTAGSGGTLTTFTTTFIGGYGANGSFKRFTIQ